MVKKVDYELQKVHYITIRASFDGSFQADTIVKVWKYSNEIVQMFLKFPGKGIINVGMLD